MDCFRNRRISRYSCLGQSWLPCRTCGFDTSNLGGGNFHCPTHLYRTHTETAPTRSSGGTQKTSQSGTNGLLLPESPCDHVVYVMFPAASKNLIGPIVRANAKAVVAAGLLSSTSASVQTLTLGQTAYNHVQHLALLVLV